MFRPPRSVDAGSSLPIDYVNKLPRKSNKVVLQLTLLIKPELGLGVELARALGFILVVDVEFAGRQIVGSSSAITLDLAEPKEAVGNKANFPPIRGFSHLNVTDVIAKRAGDRDVSHRFHLGELVVQSLIHAALECCVQHLLICRSGVLINDQSYGEFLSHLCFSASGGSVNRFWLRFVLGKSYSASDAEQTNQRQTCDDSVRAL